RLRTEAASACPRCAGRRSRRQPLRRRLQLHTPHSHRRHHTHRGQAECNARLLSLPHGAESAGRHAVHLRPGVAPDH
ncbi:hypothetical protein KR093_006011, partial [Drosophila rubida]